MTGEFQSNRTIPSTVGPVLTYCTHFYYYVRSSHFLLQLPVPDVGQLSAPPQSQTLDKSQRILFVPLNNEMWRDLLFVGGSRDASATTPGPIWSWITFEYVYNNFTINNADVAIDVSDVVVNVVVSLVALITVLTSSCWPPSTAGSNPGVGTPRQRP